MSPLDAILVVTLSGAGLVPCDGTWLTMLGVGICFVCMVFFGLSAPLLLVMVLFMCCFMVLLKLVSAGILLHVFGAGLPHLCQIASLFQFFKSAILEAWHANVCSDLGQRAGFSGRCALGFEGFFATLICFPPRGKEVRDCFGASLRVAF